MKRKILVISLILGFTAGMILSLTLLLRGDKDSSDKELGPEETVKAFCYAIAAGDFDTARGLCDTLSMSDYLDRYIRAWETLKKQDSTALALASSMLSETVMETERIDKNNGYRDIYYTLESGGNIQKRMATVRKEEGAWRVERITDW